MGGFQKLQSDLQTTSTLTTKVSRGYIHITYAYMRHALQNLPIKPAKVFLFMHLFVLYTHLFLGSLLHLKVVAARLALCDSGVDWKSSL